MPRGRPKDRPRGIIGRRQAKLDQAADELGERVTAVRGDVSDLGDLDRLYAGIAARGTGLDVLFANAGGGAFTRLEDLTPEPGLIGLAAPGEGRVLIDAEAAQGTVDPR